INECLRDELFICIDNSVCVNNEGGYTCSCSSGFQNISGICEDIRECELEMFSCPRDSTCVNTFGGYSCKCNPGFTKLADQCEPNEVATSPPAKATTFLTTTPTAPTSVVEEPCDNLKCGKNSECKNDRQQLPECVCNTGYTQTRQGCIDIDECENSTLFSCAEFSSCVNLDGGYTCDCDDGFSMMQGGICEDIDECQNSTLFTCPSHSECVNLNGTYKCRCVNDYFKNELGLCEGNIRMPARVQLKENNKIFKLNMTIGNLASLITLCNG
ncbi:protein kinase C-binding protein NELL2, partial [Elysia marginata]